MSGAILGIDLGTGSVKAIVVDPSSGTVLGIGSAEHPTYFPEPNAAEQTPGDWWQATVSACQAALAAAGNGVAIHRMGITGQMHGTVLLDDECQPIGNAIIWADSRSAGDAWALMTEAGEEIIRIAGSPVAAGFQAATLRWLQRERLELWRQVRHILLPKDYLRFRLTGVLATDPSDAAGTLLSDRVSRDWSPRLLDLAGAPREFFPGIQPSASVAGTLTPAAANELGLTAGTPVITGTADAAAAALGAGVVRPGQLLVTLSTGAQVLMPRSAPEFDPRGRLHTFASSLEPASGTGWYIMGATMAAGMALRWLRDAVFEDRSPDAYDRLMALAGSAPIGSGRLLFLPHLAGQRSPELNPLARGSFVGLAPSHDRPHLTRAVLEGVSFSIYDAYRAVHEVVSDEATEIILAGGGSRGPLWRSMLADLFNLPVRPLDTPEQTAMGAAVLASGADPAATAVEWAQFGSQVLPDPDRHSAYQELFAIYREASAALSQTFASLAAFPA